MRTLSFEKWENRENWVNFDGKKGDGDENDDNDNDDDEIMRNERIHDAIYGSRIKLKLVMMIDWAAYLSHKVKDQGLSRFLDPKFKPFSRFFPKQ